MKKRARRNVRGQYWNPTRFGNSEKRIRPPKGNELRNRVLRHFELSYLSA